MLAQLVVIFAAVCSAVERLCGFKFEALAVLVVAAVTLGGCLPTALPLTGVGPADPGARVAGVGYRSTIAPYTSLRPTAPSSWREQNEHVVPSPKSEP